jgi:hypothetical protein
MPTGRANAGPMILNGFLMEFRRFWIILQQHDIEQ